MNITVDNLTFYNDADNAWISIRNETAGYASTNIIIQNCTFNAVASTWAGIFATYDVSNVSILNNTFHGGIGSAGVSDVITFVGGSGKTTSNILIQGNDIEGGSHNAVDIQSYYGTMEYVVVKGNKIHNPNHTSLNIYGTNTFPQYVLVDDNDIYDAGAICGASSCPANLAGSEQDRGWPMQNHPGMQWSADYGIVRRNRFYNNGGGSPDIQNTASHNRYYHNVIEGAVRGSYINTTASVDDNIFKNNIWYNNTAVGTVQSSPIFVASGTDITNSAWLYNNIEAVDIGYLASGYRSLAYLEAEIPDCIL